MRIIDTSNPPSDLSQFETNALYNGMDVLITRAVFDAIHPLLDDTTRKTYEFSLALQGPVMEMMFTGCPVDLQCRQDLIQEHQHKLEKLSDILNQLADAVGYRDYFLSKAIEEAETGFRDSGMQNPTPLLAANDRASRSALKKTNPVLFRELDAKLKFYSRPFNGASNRQKTELLYDLRKYKGYRGPFGITPITVKDKITGELRITADRDALEKIQKVGEEKWGSPEFYARPIIACILAIMDCKKIIGQLNCRLDDDGYFRTSYGIAGTETGRFNSNSNPFGVGNNAQNWAPDLRRIFVSEPGWKIGAPDSEQAESRAVGAICFRLFGDSDYLDACESGDLHTLVCQLIWPKLNWPSEFNLDAVKKYGKLPPDLLKAAKKVAAEIFYRNFTYRDLSKRGGHGTNYYGTPFTMAKNLHIEKKIMEAFQDAYFEAFHAIKRWHRWVAEQLQTTRIITTFLGRRRQFFGRPYDDATLREAIAFEPQSVATGDYTNMSLLSIWKQHFPIKLFLQKHDEIGFRYREEDEEWIIPKICSLMEHNTILTSPSGEKRVFSIPADPQVGWNLGHFDPDTNPGGLKKWSGKDERARPDLPVSSLLAIRVS